MSAACANAAAAAAKRGDAPAAAFWLAAGARADPNADWTVCAAGIRFFQLPYKVINYFFAIFKKALSYAAFAAAGDAPRAAAALAAAPVSDPALIAELAMAAVALADGFPRQGSSSSSRLYSLIDGT